MVTQKSIDAVFKAVGDPTRRAILEALLKEPLAVQAIAERFSTMSRPAISKHLRILREAGLVDEEQQGRRRYYHLRRGSLVEIERWLGPFQDSEVRKGPRKRIEAAGDASRSGAAASARSVAWRVW